MNSKLHKECPDYEDVSAFFDGELDPSSPDFLHIESCEKCQRRLDQYKKVSSSICDEFKAAVPEHFAENLIAAIKKRQEEQKQKASVKPFPFHIFMKAAAVFIISGIALFIFKQDHSSPDSFDPSTAEPLVFLDKPVPPGNLSKLKFPPTRENAAAGSGSIDIKDLMKVSSGNSNDYDLFDIKDPEDCAACIQPEVSQVWSVDNLDNAEQKFAEFADDVTFAKDKNGNAVAVIKITKKELAELVRKCKTAGFRLLSPSQPQPEQVTFSGNKNDKVCYTATLIQSGE